MTEAESIPQIDSLTEPEKKTNWGKRVLIVGAVVFVAVGLLRMWQARQYMKRLPDMLPAAVEQMFKDIKLPEEERTAAMVPVKAFAEKIRNKEVTFKQVRKVLDTIFSTQFQGILCARIIQIRFVPPSTLTDEEKAAANVVATRFAEGLRHDQSRIPTEETMPLFKLILEQKKNEEGKEIVEIKESLTDEELESCLTLMRTAAEKAEIPDQKFDIDLAAELQTILDAGLKE